MPTGIAMRCRFIVSEPGMGPGSWERSGCDQPAVTLILRQALAGDAADDLQVQGLGSRIAALFAEAALEEPIPEWHGEAAVAAMFEP